MEHFIHMMIERTYPGVEAFLVEHRKKCWSWARGACEMSSKELRRILVLKEAGFDPQWASFDIKEVLSEASHKSRPMEGAIEPNFLDVGLARETMRQLGVQLDTCAWSDRFTCLLSFRMRAGNCSVSKAHSPVLGKWIENLRHQGTSDYQLRNCLMTIKFDWSPRVTAWEVNFVSLQKYKAKNKNCLVPKRHKLGNWVSKQRELRRSLDLSLGVVLDSKGRKQIEKIQRLDDIGFCWSPCPSKASTWDSFHNKLRVLNRVHGSCVVPKHQKALASWVNRQREDRKKCQNRVLADPDAYRKRIRKLDALGFHWDPEVLDSV